jgi:hypothetical protein
MMTQSIVHNAKAVAERLSAGQCADDFRSVAGIADVSVSTVLHAFDANVRTNTFVTLSLRTCALTGGAQGQSWRNA